MRNIIRDMLEYDIRIISEYEETDIDNGIKDIKDWIYNFTIHILADRLKGKKRDEYTLQDKQHILAVSINLADKYIKYGDIFNTFFITNIFPVSIANVKDMVRESIVLSDTDSTCASYESWVHWYTGKEDYSSYSVGIAASVMTIVTQVVDHYIKLFGSNMNITYDRSKVLEMKNEFFWNIFVNTNVSKHYFANVSIQEGNIYNFEDKSKTLEKKGVHLIAPNAYTPIRDLAEELMVQSMDEISSGKKIELNYYINKVLEAENIIISKLQQASPDVLKLEKIKEAKSYKLEPSKSPYFHHILWENVFANTYGKAPDPTYMAIKLPTIINSKNLVLSICFKNSIPNHFHLLAQAIRPGTSSKTN